MANDSNPVDLRVAVETLLTTGLVVVAGEVRTDAYAPVARLVRDKIIEIGYDHSDKGFDGTHLRCAGRHRCASPRTSRPGVDDGHESRVG